MSVAENLLDELVAEPTTERYLVYADLLQTQGDSRGELIALAVHAETTGTPPSERQRELEAQLTAALGDAIGGAKIQLVWERGFVRDLVFAATAIDPIVDGNWLDRDAFALTRSIGIHDAFLRAIESPVGMVVQAPFARVLERVAFGFPQCAPLEGDEVARLFAELPRLRGFELRGRHAKGGVIGALEKCDRLEELGLWAAIDEPMFATLIDAPWPRLHTLRIQGNMRPINRLPLCIGRLLDGERHPELVELAMMGCGFETPLVIDIAQRALGKRLRRLGLDWRKVDGDTLEAVTDAFANIELVWPRAVGMPVLADEEYILARRLRVGLDRDAQALPHAERACELRPGDYFHWLELGYAYSSLDRPEDTIRAMTRASEIDPKHQSANCARGAALRDLSRFEEAEAVYRVALEHDAKAVQVHDGLGRLYARCGQSNDAIAAFERAAEIATGANRAPYFCSVAEVHVESSGAVAATGHYLAAKQVAPDSLQVGRLGGYLLIWGNDPAEALRTAQGLDPTSENDTYGTRALEAAALRDLDRASEASRFYERIADDADCPAWIAFAWLGLATIGHDPFAPIAAVVDPARVADAIGEHLNPIRARNGASGGAYGPTHPVHETSTRTDDRIHAAVCALAGAAVAGRLDETRARAGALAAYLAGPAPVKHNGWWLELAELMRAAATRSPAFATVIETAYRVTTGRLPPTALDP